MKERILTCIVCPRGCTLRVELGESSEVISVSGQACKRGAEYANTECTAPRRTVTSTVRCRDGGVVAVKTDGTVPKQTVFAVMSAINAAIAPNEVKIGDVIIADAAGTGVNVVATANRVK